MKLITSTLLSLFFACSVALGQGTLTITDNGSHIILNVEGKPTSYPKNELTVQQKGTQAIIFKQRGFVVQQINSIAKVTSPTSVSMSDLFSKILAMFPVGSTIASNDANLVHKTGTESVAGPKTLTNNLTVAATLLITTIPATSATVLQNLTRNTSTGAIEVIDLDGIYMKSLALSASGNGSATSINLPHGLGITPTTFSAVATNAAAAGIIYVTATSTNIVVNYSVAPASGTNNLTYNILFRK